MGRKKRKKKIFLISFIIAIVLIGIIISGLFFFKPQVMFPDKYYEVPQWGSVWCEPFGEMKSDSGSVIESDNIFTFMCGAKSVSDVMRGSTYTTDMCTYSVYKTGVQKARSPKYMEYRTCDRNVICTEWKKITCKCEGLLCPTGINCDNLFKLEDKHIVYDTMLQVRFTQLNWIGTKIIPLKDDGRIDYTILFQPYYLISQAEGLGGTVRIGTHGCKLDSDWFNQKNLAVIDSNYLDEELDTYSKTPDILKPNTFYNFIYSFSPVPPKQLYTYKGQKVWCIWGGGGTRKLFGFSEVTTPSGTYHIWDPGKYIDDVSCCPGETIGGQTCGKNFRWIPIEEKECDLFHPCPSAGQWQCVKSKTISTTKCVDNKCVVEYKTVDCCYDSDCEVTETCINWECTKSILPGPIDKCETDEDCPEGTVCYEDGICRKPKVDENITNLDKLRCEEGKLGGLVGGQWVTATTEVPTFWSTIGLSTPKIITEPYCKYDWTFVLIIGGVMTILIIVLPIVIILVRRSIPKRANKIVPKKRKRRKK